MGPFAHEPLTVPAVPAPGTVVGRVAGLWRYPVKAMAAEPLDRAEVAWYGIAGDRRWGFTRDAAAATGFPWLTIRQRPDLVRYAARLVDRDRPDSTAVVVRTPAGDDVDVTDPALAGELGDGVRAIKLDRGAFDAAPLSVLTTGSLDALGEVAGGSLSAVRFRPNVLVATGPAAGAWPEDGWVGGTLAIGPVVLHVDRPDRRCVVVDVDPATGRKEPGVLRAIARHHGGTFGTYAAPVRPGTVAVGDPVMVVSSPVPEPGPVGVP